MKISRWALILLAVSGCATRGPSAPLAPFTELAYQPYGVSGTAIVTGNSFLINKGGDVKRGAGRTVLLIPDTDFLRYRLDGRVYDAAADLDLHHVETGVPKLARVSTSQHVASK